MNPRSDLHHPFLKFLCGAMTAMAVLIVPVAGEERKLTLKDITTYEDPVEAAAKVLKEQELRKDLTFEEARAINDKLRNAVALLVKEKHSACKEFFRAFQRSPELPYQRVGWWHIEYHSRGVQGTFAKAIIESGDQEQMRQMYALLESAEATESVKRTIVWSMRYDNTPETAVFLRRLVQLGNEKMAQEAREALQSRERMDGKRKQD